MTQKLTDQITDLFIDNYDVGSFDDDRNMYQADGTTLNVKYNMGDKYLLGGRCDQAAYALTAAKDWFDTAEMRCHQANEDHGPQSLRAQRAQLDLSKAQAKLANAQMFFEIDTNLFYTFTGVIWGEVTSRSTTDVNGGSNTRSRCAAVTPTLHLPPRR